MHALAWRNDWGSGVESVLLVVSDEGVRAQVTGVAHRLPLTRRVSLHTASALIRAGARWSTVDERTPPPV